MRRALLLIVLGSLAMGCGGKSNPVAPQPTRIEVSLDQSSCQAKLCGPAVGVIASVSSSWHSNQISLSPGSKVAVDVPGAGAYRIYFEARAIPCEDLFPTVVHWDFTINADAARTTPAGMTCGGAL